MSNDEKTIKNAPEGTDLAEELQVYELGFHVLPIVAEEKLEEEVSKIKSIIEKNQGLFIGEESSPKMINLAYSMEKVIDNKKTDFDNAYFGWVKFEASPSSIDKIHNALEKLENILRFLLIKSVRESKMIFRKPGVVAKTPAETSRTVKKEESEPISEAQVDQAIEEMVKE